jgi:hypothetical protein
LFTSSLDVGRHVLKKVVATSAAGNSGRASSERALPVSGNEETPASEAYWFDPDDENAVLYSPSLSPIQLLSYGKSRKQ